MMKVTGWRIFGSVIGTLAIGMLEVAFATAYSDLSSILAFSSFMLVLWGLTVVLFFADHG